MTGLRPALTTAAIGVATLGGLLALEYVPSASAPPATTVVNTVNQAGSSEEHTRHCTDGNGQDFLKNKHCRDVSGAQ